MDAAGNVLVRDQALGLPHHLAGSVGFATHDGAVDGANPTQQVVHYHVDVLLACSFNRELRHVLLGA